MSQFFDLDNRELMQSPSPVRYQLKSSIGAGLKVTMGAKHYDNQRRTVSPEPATYAIKSTIGRTSPMLTMGGRQRVIDPSLGKPGPAHYSPQRQQYGPSMVLGSRTYAAGLNPRSQSPEPCRYSLPSMVGKNVSVTMAARSNFMDFQHINKDTLNVGPGSHNVPGKLNISGQITLKSRTGGKVGTDSPGPAAYGLGTNVGKHAPKVTISGRPPKRGLLILDTVQ